MSQSTNHTHNQNSDGSYHCYACLKEGATDYDADADGFTRGTIPADERIVSRKLAQGSTNPKDDLDEIIPCTTGCGSNADPADGFGRCTCGGEQKRQEVQEYVTLARNELTVTSLEGIVELLKSITPARPEDLTMSQWHGLIGAIRAATASAEESLAALQRDSQPGGTDNE